MTTITNTGITIGSTTIGGTNIQSVELVGTSTVSTDALQGVTSSGVVAMPPGSIVQMGGDTWNPGSVLDITTTGTDWCGANLQVSMTFRSTSNKFFIQVHIPDGYNLASTTRALDGGFLYSTDSYSSHSAVLGPQQIISDHMGYSGSDTADLHPHLYNTWGTVPTTSPVTIRPYLKAKNGTYRVNANSMGVYSLTVMEIQG